MTATMQATQTSDEKICESKFELAARERLFERSIGDVMVAIGTTFVGTPYEARTLELEGEERLVVNLRELDCVTFVESTLALSRCIRLRKHGFAEYMHELQRIRYRNEEIAGYPSRLHYFTDWIFDNQKKKIVRDVTMEIGGVKYKKEIRFMSEHREAYRQLADESVAEKIRAREAELNRRELTYIPKERIEEVQGALIPGDIVGITTTVEGLDVSHTGIVVHANGIVKYLHAPMSGGAVQISENSLSRYLAERKKHTGIVVARPLEPQG